MAREPYTRDVEFPSSFVPAQAPLNMSCAAALGGFRPPSPAAGFAYCELGCSAGTTLNPLAAVNPEAAFVGVDFNADHVKRAASGARSASIENVSYVESSFEDLEGHGLPQFDFIAMNGTYSWLTPEAEEAAIAFVGGHLRDGGLFYVDSMTMPGKAAIAPVWRLMRAMTANDEGDSTERARAGLATLNELREKGAAFFEKNPPAAMVLQAVTSITKDSPAGLRHTAHHTLAEGWRAKYFSELSADLAPAGLRFAGSAELKLNEIDLVIPPPLREIVEAAGDPELVETLKDYILDQQQRKDVFIKHGDADPAGAAAFLRSEVFAMACGPLAVMRQELAKTARGQFRFDGDVFAALVAALQHLASLEDVAASPALQAFEPALTLDAFRKLVASEALVLSAAPGA